MTGSERRWPTRVAEAKIEQQVLRKKVRLEGCIGDTELSLVAGTDVAFKQGGSLTRAVVAVFSFPSLVLLEQSVVEVPTRFPYVPGYLSYRELPAIIQAWENLQLKPQLFLCDGQGIAHPRRLGLAAHLGVLLSKPAIGVAKTRLVGQAPEPGETKGAVAPLMEGEEQLGWVLRSRTKVKPIFVSPGHAVSMAQSLRITLACCSKYRLPEPTRIADKISKS